MASARVLASVPRHQAAALDAIRKLLYAPNYHAAFEGAQALGRIGIHGAALKKDAENLLGRIEKVDEQAGYLPPPLGQSRTLCQRFLDSLK